MVTDFHAGHAFAYFDDDAGAFMAQYYREQAFRIIARKCESIRMAYTGIGDLDQHFALAWRLDVDLDDLERLARFKCNCSTRLHVIFSN